jgi:hypothetical protein
VPPLEGVDALPLGLADLGVANHLVFALGNLVGGAETVDRWNVSSKRVARRATMTWANGTHQDVRCTFYLSPRIPLTRSQARLEARMESLLLFRRALASPTMCRFIPALSVSEMLRRICPDELDIVPGRGKTELKEAIGAGLDATEEPTPSM